MKNNFDLKGYMKSNQVGSYQQLNEMWYQDITEALGDFNEAKVITKEEMEVGNMPLKVSLDYADYPSISDSEQKMAINQFMKLVKSLGGNATKTADKFSTIDFEISGGPSFEALQAAYDKQAEDMFASVLASWKLTKSELEEMGGVKNVGDKGKMATPNSRPNLGRHRSSDTLDKQVAKDHDKKTVVGAKAAAYKAPHMKEEEAADDIFAGSDTANWNGKAERMDWEKDLVGKEVGNWKSDIEQQAGSISWTSEKYPNAIIYATPGWEGVDGIAVEVHESEDGYLDEPKLQKVVAAGTDLWKTKEGYLALMAKIFTTLEKMLTPAEMTEDHGTQINHDMNDDISTDHTEPEHMVQNEEENNYSDEFDSDRFWDLGGRQLADIVNRLIDDGFSLEDIIAFIKNF